MALVLSLSFRLVHETQFYDKMMDEESIIGSFMEVRKAWITTGYEGLDTRLATSFI